VAIKLDADSNLDTRKSYAATIDANQHTLAAACSGVEWRTAADEDGHYCFAATV